MSLPGSTWSGVNRSNQSTVTSEIIPVNLDIPFGETWTLKFYASPFYSNGFYVGTGAEIQSLSIDADVSSIFMPTAP